MFLFPKNTHCTLLLVYTMFEFWLYTMDGQAVAHHNIEPPVGNFIGHPGPIGRVER